MIILDTNVISALMLPVPDRTMVAWLNRYPLESLWLTSINVFEIRFGIERLVQGRKRRQLEDAFARLQDDDLEGRTISFDRKAAEEAAAFLIRRRAAGRPVEFRDVQIAGIVAAQSATLATRNLGDFQDFAIDTVNPWAA